jgi:hypothetical protein
MSETPKPYPVSETPHAEVLARIVKVMGRISAVNFVGHPSAAKQLERDLETLHDLSRYLEVHEITPETVLPEADIEVLFEGGGVTRFNCGEQYWEQCSLTEETGTPCLQVVPKKDLVHMVLGDATHYRLALPWGDK